MDDYAMRKFVVLRRIGDPADPGFPAMIQLSKDDLRTVNKSVTFAKATPEVSTVVVRLRPSIIFLDREDAPADLRDFRGVDIQIRSGELISMEADFAGDLYLSDIMKRPYPDMIETDVVIGDDFKTLFARDQEFRDHLMKTLEGALFQKIQKEM